MLRGTEESSQFQRKNHTYELKWFFSRLWNHGAP